MRHTLRSFNAPSTRRAHRPAKRLALEQLETRDAPAAGGLDPDFGTSGKVTTPFGPVDDRVEAIAIDSLGRIVVAGSVDVNASPLVTEFLVARYLPDGKLDNTFGGGDGNVTTSFGSTSSFAQGVVIDKLGRIVAAGYSNIGGNWDVAVARYNSDGSPDTSFSGDGLVTTDVAGREDAPRAVTIDSVGRIVVAGETHNGSSWDAMVLRYTDLGVLDGGFDGDGITTTDHSTRDDYISGLVIDSLDRVVIAGSGFNGSNFDFEIIRYTATGGLDPSFLGTGHASDFIGPGDEKAESLAIDSQGRIVVGGWCSNLHNWDFMVLRIDPSTGFDPSFGGTGRVTTSVAGSEEFGASLAIDAQGRIVLAGAALNGATWDGAVVRYLDNGALDPEFDGDGRVITSFGASNDYFLALALTNSGRIVAAGHGYNGANFDVALAQYFAEPYHLVPGATTFTYTEDDGARAIDPLLAVADTPNRNLVGATVTVGNFIRTEDVLGFTLQAGINANYDAFTGVLTLSGTAGVEEYLNVLHSLTYTNTSQRPLELDRTITVSVDDGSPAGNIATASYTIHIVARNDAPTLTDDGLLPAVVQGTASPPGRAVSSIFAGLFTDPDAGDLLKGVAVVGNPADAAAEGKWQYSTDGGATWFDVGAVAEGPSALALSAATKLRFFPQPWFFGDVTPLIVRALDSSFAGAFTNGGTRQTSNTLVNGGTTPISAQTADVLTSVLPNSLGGAWLVPGGDLLVHGTPGNDVINVRIPADATKFEVVLNDQVVGLFAQAAVTGEVVVHGFAGNDRIGVAAKITKPVELLGEAGNDVLTGAAGDDVLNGGAGNDMLIGAGGSDRYRFDDAWGIDTVTEGFKQGTDTLDFSAVTGPLTVTAQSATILGAAAGAKVTAMRTNMEGVIGGASIDTLSSPSGANTWAVTGKNQGTLNKTLSFASFESLTGGSSSDAFVLANGQGVTGALAGGGGINTLDYGAYTTPVGVNLESQAATNVGSFTGITSIRGGSAADIITGPDVANRWTITGTDAGTVGRVKFTSFGFLVGGTQADTFAFANAKGVSGIIDGGGGTNALNYAAYATAVQVNLTVGTATGTAGIANIADVFGGSADDILVGGTGANALFGGAGRDILIGAAGADALDGGASDDVLVGGATTLTAPGFAALMAEWSRTNVAYAVRVDRLSGVRSDGANGVTFLNAITVSDDASTDMLTGGSEIDWFVFSAGDGLVDRLASEQALQI